MYKKLWIAIGIGLGLFWISIFVQTTLRYQRTINRQKTKLDSLYTYQQTLQVMAKTLTVAYPQLSAYEAKYYSYIFYDFAHQYNVDWTWYPALVRAETNWNHTLISSKKARGLVQITSVCASAQAKKLGINYIEGYTEWNEVNCFAMGLDYFSQGFVIDPSYAVKRYIGGPGFDNAGDTNRVAIIKYEKDVALERNKVDSIFQEHNKLFYISKGVASEEQK